MRTISLIIIHCSATPEGQDVTVADIDRWHRARNWDGCGYHYVIYQDGSIHLGRPLEKKGAHVKNHNDHSIGICYIGGLCHAQPLLNGVEPIWVPADTRTEAQKQALRSLLTDLHLQFPQAIILGHRDLSPDLNGDGRITANEYLKLCPCFDAMLDYSDLQPEGFWEGTPIYN